jgi:PhnB protein
LERPATAVDFYERGFRGACPASVGDGEDIVAQLAVGEGAFWVGSAAEGMGRFSPGAIGGGTCRILVTVDDPDAFVERAVGAGATETSPVGNEHGWRLGRIVDPFGHEWEIGRPPAGWPPVSS